MIVSKIKVMLIMSVCFALQNVHGMNEITHYQNVSIHYPRLDQINLRTDQISKEFAVDHIKKLGIKGLAAVGVTLSCYKAIQWLTISKPPVLPIVSPDWALVGPTYESRLQKLEQTVYPDITTLQWLKQKSCSAALSCTEGLVTLAAAHVIWNKLGTYLSQELYHPDYGTMKWYASNKTTFLSALEELRQHVHSLGSPSACLNNELNTIFIISSVNNVVDQLETIIGFMNYKKSLAPEQYGFEMSQASRYLFNVGHQFCSNIEKSLDSGDMSGVHKKEKIESMLCLLKSEVARIIISFSRLEKESNK